MTLLISTTTVPNLARALACQPMIVMNLIEICGKHEDRADKNNDVADKQDDSFDERSDGARKHDDSADMHADGADKHDVDAESGNGVLISTITTLISTRMLLVSTTRLSAYSALL